jgi:hypothetical protein
MSWDLADFAFAAFMILGAGVLYALARRTNGSRAYRAGAAVALGTVFLIVWVNAAVGIIGAESNPVNLIFFGVLAVVGIGACLARFRPRGMDRAMLAAALAQAAAAGVAFAVGRGIEGLFTLALCGPWLVSAWLFRRAADAERVQTETL